MEQWKDIPGYEGLYQVSDLGRVKSLYKRTGKEIILVPFKTSKGYYRITLCKNKERYVLFVHRIVWETFNGPIPENMQINHINEDKTDNRLNNLNLMTPKENCNWGTRNERKGEKKQRPIIQFDLDGKPIKEYKKVTEVEELYGFSHSNICNCCNGKRKTAYGFVWRYAV